MGNRTSAVVWTMTCAEPSCGRKFKARREHARFCGEYCRVKADKRKRREARDAANL